MKKPGSTSDFISTRDRELYANFIQLLRNSELPLKDMFGAAAKMACSRFWVSERHAAEVISCMRRNADPERVERMYGQKRAMYCEILRRVEQLMERQPELCLQHAVDAVVCGEAPEFYLTGKSARVIIYRHRRKLRETRKEAERKNAAARKALGFTL